MTKYIEFDLIEKQIRKKTFGVLTTIDSKGRPHSTGILYGVSPPESDFALYFMTMNQYKKVHNIQKNPMVSFVITFPHYYLRFVPDNYLMLRGTAEIHPFDDPDGQWAFQQKRILRMNMKVPHEVLRDAVFIKMRPEPTIFCFGVGYGLMDIARHMDEVMYKVTIPDVRFVR